MSRLKEKLLGILLLTAILPFQGLLYCFAVAENSGQWSFSDPNNYILDDTIQVAAGVASLKTNDNPVAWYNASWLYRKPITIDNSGGSDLGDYQIKVVLNAANFDYTKAKSAGADIRLADSDGVSLLDYWIETWNVAGDSIIWAKVPAIAAGASKTVYLYYGNSAAISAESGDDTFMFFDDFDSLTADSYFPLSEAQTVMEFDQLWENAAPHTLSVLELNSGGYKYWGWYGLQSGGGVGLSRSNDLMTWTKYESNPLFYNGRWPNVMKLGDVFYMVYTKDFGFSPTNIQLATSNDGISFTNVKTLVDPIAGENNQNPNLFHNPNDGKYYLYWFHGNGLNVWNIKVRVANSIEDLDVAETTTILTAGSTLAAPNIMYYDGLYYLSTEIVGPTGWEVKIYTSASPISGFTVLPGNPILKDGSACLFQHVFGTTMHGYYCKYEVAIDTWRLDYRTADLTAPRVKSPLLDDSKWTALSGIWALQYQEIQTDGSLGAVIKGDSGYLRSSYQDDNYVIELSGKQVIGRMWGLGLRFTDLSNFYAVNLYEDLDNNANLYLYNISPGGSAVATANLGVVDPNVWYKMTVKIHADIIDVYINDSLEIQATNSRHSFGNLALINESFTAAYFDNLIVHQYVAVEPSAVVGSESMVYSDANPTIQASADNSFVFNRLYSFAETATKNGGEIKYILSNDGGSTWLYYNNGWVASDGSYSQSNTAAEIQNSIQSFPTGEQRFIFRIFLHSSGIQSVSLDNLIVTGGLFTASSSKSSIVSTPQSSIVAPLSDQLLFLNQIVIEGISSDNGASSIQKVEISTDNGLNWSDVVPVAANNHYGFDWEYAWTPSVLGTYRLLTRATSWNGVVELGNSGLTLNIVSKVDKSDNQNQQTRSILPFVLASATSQTEIQAQITTIQQQIIVLIQQLIAQLLVELQAIR